jgi:hypothetical protein
VEEGISKKSSDKQFENELEKKLSEEIDQLTSESEKE